MKTEKLEIVTVPTQLKPVVDSSKIEVSKAQMHAIAFAPSMQDYLTIADNITGLNKVDPSETDAKTARENRLKLVKVRTGAEEIKDVRKEGIKAEGDLIQALFNVVKNSCIVTETEFLEIEKHQERKEKERQDNLSTERITLLAPFEYDITYLPLGVMTDEQFEKVLDNAKLLFNTRKEKEEAARLAQIEADKKAEEERIAKEKADDEAREAQRVENERLKKEAEIQRADAEKLRKENEARLAKQQTEAETERKRLAKVADEKLAEKQKQQDRQDKMFRLGLNWDGQTFIYKDINFHWTDLLTMSDEKFNKAYEGASKRMEVLKQDEHIEREKLEAELKAKRDAEAKIEADRLAALSAPDKEKINALYKTIKELAIPDFATPEAQKIGKMVTDRIGTILAEIKELSKTLK